MAGIPFHSRGPISPDLLAWEILHRYDAEFERIYDAIWRTPCEYANVIAPIQSGKTTFLRWLRVRLTERSQKVVTAVIDFEYLGDRPSEADVVHAVWESVREALKRHAQLIPPTQSTEAEDYNDLKAFLKAVGGRVPNDAAIVLLIDEVESLPMDCRTAILGFFRSLHATREDDGTQRMSVVLTSTQPLQVTSLGSVSPYNIGLEVTLSDLSWEAFMEFLRRAEPHLDGAAFSPDAIEYLYSQTEGHLALVQEICVKVCNNLVSNHRVVTNDVLEAIASLLEHPSRVLATHVMRGTLPLDEETQDILGRLICSEPVLPFAFRTGISALLAGGIAKIDASNRCVMRSPLLKTVFAKAFAKFPDLPALNFSERCLLRLPQLQIILVNTQLAEDAEREVARLLANSGETLTAEIVDDLTHDVHRLLQMNHGPDLMGAKFFYKRYFPDDRVHELPDNEMMLKLVAKIFVHWALYKTM